CLLYRMVTGREAFAGADNGETLTAILAGRRPELPRALPERWRVAIDAALRPDPQARPQSCAALRALWEAPDGVLLERGLLPVATPDPTTELQTPALPSPRNRFVGRERALEEVAERVREHRLVTVLGMGGIGKTRLALELARRMQGAWSGGVRMVSLVDARSADGIHSATADALGVTAGDRRGEQVVEALQKLGPVLLVTDNFEQVVEHAAATVGQWLDAVPDLRVLVTSHAPLGLPGEHTHALGLLDEGEAIELFVERAHDVGAPLQLDDHRTHLVDLVRLLDRLPLAIELAAARSRLLSPGALLARLRRRFDVLGIQARDLPERHRTLRATLQWSWELLTPLQRSVLAQLSVFEGGFTVAAAQGVVDLGTELGWVEDVLAELVEKGLLLVDDDERLRMLVSVQAFAAEQLTHPVAAQARHGAWFADHAATEPSGLERSIEHDNLIAAARRAVDRGDPAIAARVTVEAAEIFFLRGPIQPGLDLVDDVLPLATEPKHRLPLLRVQGRLINRLETPRKAADPHLEAVALAREAGIADELAYHLGYLGELAADGGRWDEATRFFEQSAEAARSDGRPFVMFVPLLRLARLALSMGQLDLADERFAEVVALSDVAGRPKLLAHLHGLIGNLRVRQRRLSDARHSYTRAVAYARDRDDAMSVANWTIGLATVAESEANYPEAIAQVTAA
ncbi:MAG: hypothetical protein AAF602_27890, partial [Myxococcota bacterium]